MALKIAFQYQHQIGQKDRTKFACLSEGYHGETIGALSCRQYGFIQLNV